MQQEPCLILNYTEGIARIQLSRPTCRNAFNPQLINELTALCEQLSTDESIRVVSLTGAGTHFSAGADLSWMRSMAQASREENLADALALTKLLDALNSLPQLLIAAVQGGAYGGALGLLACCDTVICSADCRFAFTEVCLGLSPATIAPYVISKIGLSHARDLMTSARDFNAAHALHIGLVHEVVPPDYLAHTLEGELKAARQCGPRAVLHTKALLAQLHPAVSEEQIRLTAQLIADLRVSPEGQEGLAAFFEKRRPTWAALR